MQMIEVRRIAHEKQILINRRLNEMCNYPLIVCSALFLLLPAETERFPQYTVPALEDTFKCKWTPLLKNNAYSFHWCRFSGSPGFLCSNLSSDWTFIPLLRLGSVVRRISLRCRSSDFLSRVQNEFVKNWMKQESLSVTQTLIASVV